METASLLVAANEAAYRNWGFADETEEAVQFLPARAEGMSIVIPIKVSSLTSLAGLRECLAKLLSHPFPFELEVIITDESPDDVFAAIDGWFQHEPRVTHICPRDECRTGRNDKLNGIYDAMNHVSYDYIVLVDDHYRLSVDNLDQILSLFGEYDCFKCMVDFDQTRISSLVDVCGIFIINMLHPYRQFCGHLCFNLQTIKEIGFPSRDMLFDELGMELQFRKHQKKVHFADKIFFEAVQKISWKRFFEQRLRYAYENFAFPLRFSLFLCVLPLILACALIGKSFAIGFIVLLTLAVVCLGLVGQIKYRQGRFPVWTFLLSPVWFWFYPFTTWLAIVYRLRGGVKFGGRKILRAV